jgi:hydroxymethylpyrimidine pyrophosphatase-like HAD family hydrolase
VIRIQAQRTLAAGDQQADVGILQTAGTDGAAL